MSNAVLNSNENDDEVPFWRQRLYRLPFIISLILHITLLILLTMSFVSTPEPHPLALQLAPQQPEIVQAVAINQSQVDQMLKQLDNKQKQKVQQEKQRQQQLQRKAAEAKAAEQKAKQQLAALEKKRVQEQKRLVEIEKQTKAAAEKQKQVEAQQKAEAERLTALQKQQALDKQQQVAAEKAAEAKRIADKKAQEALAKKQADEQRLAAQRAASDAAQTALVQQEIQRYTALIVQAIGDQWIIPENVDQKLSAKFLIRLAPDGEVLNVTLQSSSGDPVLDRSASSAIYKASPLPVPTDAAAFAQFRQFSLTVRPEQIVSQ